MVRFEIDYGKTGVRVRARDRLDKVCYFHEPINLARAKCGNSLFTVSRTTLA